MGYCYDDGGRLCCDGCGHAGGVRKRTCPHKVSHKQNGRTFALPCCYPPALCPDCWEREGKTAGIHGKCKAAAAKSQAEEDQKQAKIDAGGLKRGAAWGDWDDRVPAGMAGVIFLGKGHTVEPRLIPKDRYNAHDWLDEFDDAEPWPAYDGQLTKQVG